MPPYTAAARPDAPGEWAYRGHPLRRLAPTAYVLRLMRPQTADESLSHGRGGRLDDVRERTRG